MIRPMILIHRRDKPPSDDIPAIIDRVRVNVGLRPNEVKLLTYYANQSTGYRPAKKTISKATGIDPGNIKRYRQSLKQLGIIDVSEYKRTIWINWPVICGYALLKRPLVSGPGRSRSYFHQHRPDTFDYLELVEDWTKEAYHDCQPCNIDDCLSRHPLSNQQKECFIV